MKQTIKTLAILYSVFFFIYYIISSILMIGEAPEPDVFSAGMVIWNLFQLYLFTLSAFIIADNSDKVVDFSWENEYILTYGWIAFHTVGFIGIIGEKTVTSIYTFYDWIIFIVFMLISWFIGFIPKCIAQR